MKPFVQFCLNILREKRSTLNSWSLVRRKTEVFLLGWVNSELGVRTLPVLLQVSGFSAHVRGAATLEEAVLWAWTVCSSNKPSCSFAAHGKTRMVEGWTRFEKPTEYRLPHYRRQKLTPAQQQAANDLLSLLLCGVFFEHQTIRSECLLNPCFELLVGVWRCSQLLCSQCDIATRIQEDAIGHCRRGANTKTPHRVAPCVTKGEPGLIWFGKVIWKA